MEVNGRKGWCGVVVRMNEKNNIRTEKFRLYDVLLTWLLMETMVMSPVIEVVSCIVVGPRLFEHLACLWLRKISSRTLVQQNKIKNKVADLISFDNNDTTDKQEMRFFFRIFPSI